MKGCQFIKTGKCYCKSNECVYSHTPTEKEYEIWRKSKMNAGLTSEQVGNFLVLLEDANDSQLGAMIKTIEEVIKAREMKK